MGTQFLVTCEGAGSEIQVVMEGCFPCQEMAVKNEVGLLNNPLKISWLEGQPQSRPSTVLPDCTSQPRTSQVRTMGCGMEIWCCDNPNLSVLRSCGQAEALGARPGFSSSLSVLDPWLSKGPLAWAAAHWGTFGAIWMTGSSHIPFLPSEERGCSLLSPKPPVPL